VCISFSRFQGWLLLFFTHQCHELRQNCFASFLEWLITALCSSALTYTSYFHYHNYISIICLLFCYSVRINNASSVDELLSTQEFSVWVTCTGANYMLNAFNLGFSLGWCVATQLSQQEGNLGHDENYVVCKLDSEETHGVQTSNLPGTWSSLETETML
jgi:hypothetical protein